MDDTDWVAVPRDLLRKVTKRARNNAKLVDAEWPADEFVPVSREIERLYDEAVPVDRPPERPRMAGDGATGDPDDYLALGGEE